MNHFESCCKSKNVRELSEQNEDKKDEVEEFYIDELNVRATNKWVEQIIVNGISKVKFKLDSGAEVNIIPLDIIEKLNKFSNVSIP